jgi:hypothetical protein
MVAMGLVTPSFDYWHVIANIIIIVVIATTKIVLTTGM